MGSALLVSIAIIEREDATVINVFLSFLYIERRAENLVHGYWPLSLSLSECKCQNMGMAVHFE